MRLSDITDYFVLRRYMSQPWAFLRLRKHPPLEPFVDIPFKDGGSFRIRALPSDRGTLKSVFARDEYRLNGIGRDSLDTVVDIGAHIGAFTVRVAPLARRVLSYEPTPASYDLLVRNTTRFPHVKVHSAAVTAHRGTTTVFAMGTDPTINSLISSEYHDSATTVDSITLADIFAEHGIDRCDLLKIDCEGSEYEILHAVPKELWPRIERICMEYHPVFGGNGMWTGEGLARYLAGVGHQATIYPSKRRPRLGLLFSVRKARNTEPRPSR